MIFARIRKAKRSGATVVELAAVVIVFSMLLFGILEYCLIVYATNVVENAAREGARYAVVNVTDATMVANTQAYVKSLMGSLDTKMANYSCSVYQADTVGTLTNSDPTGAKFGEYVCVEVKLDYVPITPGLLYLKTITLRSKSSMISEAN